MSDLEVKIVGNPSGAVEAFVKVKDSARDFSKEIGQVSQDVARNLLQVAGVTLSVKAAIDGMIDGFGKGDEVRDLAMSLGVFVGSADKGREAMKYFEEQAADTRSTGLELAKVFRDEIPLAMGRGFSRESMQQITVWLSQFATVSHQSIETVQSGFESLLAGVIKNPAKNPILSFLGVTKAQVNDLGWDEVINKIADVASHADEFGQSFESTMHKVHEAWLVGFGEGVNDAMNGNRQALTNLQDALTDPAFIGALRDIGHEFADLVVSIRDIIAGYRELKAMQSGANTATFEQDHPVASWLGDKILYPNKVSRDWLLTDKTKDAMYGNFEGTWNPNAKDLRNPSPRDMFITDWDKPVPYRVPPLVGPPPTFGPPAPSAEDRLRSQLGVDTITGYAGDIHAFYAQVDRDLEQHKDKASEIIESVKDEVHGSVIAWSDYSTSVQYAVKPTNELTEAAKKNAEALGKVKFDDGKKMDAALESMLRLYTTIVEKHDAALASIKALGDYLDPVALALDEYSASITKNAHTAELELLTVAKAAKVLGDSSPEIKRLREEIQGLNKDADSEALLRYMHARTAQFAKIDLTPLGYSNADTRVQDWSLPVRGSSEILARLGMQSDDLADNEAKRIGNILGHAHGEEVRKLLLDQQFVGSFGSMLAGIFESGGKNFVSILASGLSGTIEDAAHQFAVKIFGTPGDANRFSTFTLPDGTTGAVRQDPNRLYDAAGNDITGRATAGRNIMTGVELAASGYSAGRSGQSGAQTAGAVEGFAAGMSMGNPYAAIALAIIGWGSAALGAQAKREDYKYGIPTIDSSGVAHFDQTKNYTPAEALQITRQIQGIYDSIHDSLSMILIKAGDLVPVVQGINGKFQDNPSGAFEKHLSLFESGTLPTELMNQFNGELTDLAGKFGMSANRFGEIWAALQNLDPTKAVQLLSTLFTSLESLAPSASRIITNPDGSTLMPGGKESIYDINHYSDVYMGFNPFEHMLGNIEHSGMMNPGQIIHEMDDEILKLASGLKDLSPEGQISAIAQIDSLNKQRYQAELQLAQQLFSLIKQIDAQSEAAVKNFEAQKILNEQPTYDSAGHLSGYEAVADQFGLSQFYKKAADADLREIQQAHNADQLSAAWQKYQQDVQLAEQYGYAQDPTKAGKQAWAQWGIDSEKLGQSVADGIAHALGVTLNPEQDAFNKKFDPLIDLFKEGIIKMFDPGDGSGGGGPDDPANPINKANANLANSANTMATSFTNLTPAVDTVSTKFARLSQSLDAFEARLSSVMASGSGGGSADEINAFVNWELNKRSAA